MTNPARGHTCVSTRGHEGFVALASGHARAAAADGAVPLVFADPARLAGVRSAVGAELPDLILVDMSVAGRNPSRIVSELHRAIDRHDGRRVVAFGEPFRAEHAPEVVEETRLHELILGLPELTAWNCAVTCSYDTAVTAQLQTLIETVHGDVVADPADAVDRVIAAPLARRPRDSDELGVDRTTLGALRGFVTGRALAAGLAEDRIDDLVYAVNEGVTNSICHGEGRARVSFWRAGPSVVCEVRDRGWIRDRLAGRIAPDPDRVNGRGLWLVNQLCDLVQLRSSPRGTALRMHVEGATA